jgi:uncharacterized protein YcbX
VVAVRVISLSLFPVKSLGGVDVERAAVTPLGLAGDRRWAVLDPEGRRISARSWHPLLSVVAEPTAAGVRLRSADGSLDVEAPGDDAPTVDTDVTRVERLALADPAASAWLSTRVGREVKLVHQRDEDRRPMSLEHGGREGEPLSLADTGPLHLVTEASVDRLRDWVTETQGEEWLDREAATRRFRPNVVVDGEEPFSEDGWQRLRIGGTTYRVSELCDRCALTLIDAQTLQTDKEPIRTLARHRGWDGATWFGIRLVPEGPGSIAVGDEVSV